MPSLGGNVSTRRATLRALKQRRDSMLAEKRRSQLQSGRDSTNGYLYDLPSTTMNDMGRPSTSSAYVNKGYEPAFDSDDESPRPRRSTVRFREHYA